jgi:hypothetical protein
MMRIVFEGPVHDITERHLSKLLRDWEPGDIEGLGSILVWEQSPTDNDGNQIPAYLRGYLLNGYYSAKTKEAPAHIGLITRDIYAGIPKVLVGTHVGRIKIAQTLAHEIGHHLIWTRGYIHEELERYARRHGVRDPLEEQAVDSYAKEKVELLLQRWSNRWVRSISHLMSNQMYQSGLTYFNQGDYNAAAKVSFRAFRLNGTHPDAGQLYRHALEKLKTQEPSPLTQTERDWLLNRYESQPEANGRFVRPPQKFQKRKRPRR